MRGVVKLNAATRSAYVRDTPERWWREKEAAVGGG